MELPQCCLHVMEAGEGPPLIIVPATVSELENWTDLVRFMGQWFRAYFFELPGHGMSTPLCGTFTSEAVAAVVGELADHVAAPRFSLMGFSFGGILAMKAFTLLQARIDRLVLISPCLTQRALQLTRAQRLAALQFNRLLKSPSVQGLLYGAAQNRTSARWLARLLHAVGKVENIRQLEAKLMQMRPSLMGIVSRELDEILGAEFSHPASRYDVPCHVAMSIHDPILDFETTMQELRCHFQDLHVTELFFRFHQPPRPFTLDELNGSFQAVVAASLAGYPS